MTQQKHLLQLMGLGQHFLTQLEVEKSVMVLHGVVLMFNYIVTDLGLIDHVDEQMEIITKIHLRSIMPDYVHLEQPVLHLSLEDDHGHGCAYEQMGEQTLTVVLIMQHILGQQQIIIHQLHFLDLQFVHQAILYDNHVLLIDKSVIQLNQVDEIQFM